MDKPKTSEEILKNHELRSLGVKDGKENWYGKELGAKSQPLIDPGIGQPVIIRTFMFKFNPEFIKKNKGLRDIDKQELFNNHWPLVRIELWKDGLVANEDISPKLTFKKKHYFIQIACRAKLGIVLVDTPRTLNQYLQPKKH